MQILDWFLRDENAQHWAAVKDLAAKDTPEAFEKMKKYVLEASRLTSFLALVRICVPAKGEVAQVLDDQGSKVDIKKGEVVVCNAVRAIMLHSRIYTSNTPHRLQLSVIRQCSQMQIRSSLTVQSSCTKCGPQDPTVAQVEPLPSPL